MSKLLFFVMLLCFPLVSDAQDFKYASFSYDEVLHSMPDYEKAQQTLKELKAQYEEEIKRTEEDFNNKYEDFLEVQEGLDVNIRNKRQGELHELLVKGVAFKDEANRLIGQAENDLLAPVRSRIADALAVMGKEKGYVFILNRDNNAIPYIDSALCEDVTETLKEMLE